MKVFSNVLKNLNMYCYTYSLIQYAQFYYSKGNNQYNLKDYEQAIKYYSQAIEYYPTCDEYYWRANAKIALKDYQAAMTDLNMAIRLDSNHAEYYYQRGSIKNYLGNYIEAISDFNNAIKLNPNNAEYYFQRANAKGWMKDYKGELEDLTKSIEIEPNNAEWYFRRGQIKSIFFGNKASAIMDFTCAINLDNSYTYIYLAKAELLFERNPDKAIKVLSDALRFCKEDIDEILISLSFIYFYKNEYKKSLKYANEAILYNSKNIMAYYRKYCALIGLKRYFKAIKIYEKACKLDYS